jgi:RNA 3'-terminal phosphate cyclase (ATP)
VRAPASLPGTVGPAGSAALRAALALSAIARRPFTMTWTEDLPGIDAEGVALVEVARSILGGAAEGAVSGSRSLSFVPAPVKSGTWDVGTALAAGAVLQMVAVPLALAGAASSLRLRGPTHGQGGHSFHDIAYGWLPLAERIGVAGELSLVAAGFEGDGAGCLDARIYPAPRLQGLELGSRGLLVETQALALVANLGIGIAFPLERRLSERLRASGISAQVEVLPMPAEKARGLAAVIVLQFERVRTAIAAIGQTGRPAEEVADAAVAGLQGLLSRRGAVPGPVAEDLLVPLAVAATPLGSPGVIGRDAPMGSRITTTEVTPSLLAVADVARRLLGVEIQINGLPGDDGTIEVRPAP